MEKEYLHVRTIEINLIKLKKVTKKNAQYVHTYYRPLHISNIPLH